MSLVINTNISSLISQRSLTKANNTLAVATERLSTGLRINRASDDAAGLTIPEKMRSQYRGADVASGNIQDGMNLLKVGEGDLSVIQDNLQRVRDLTVQAANDTNTSQDRSAIQTEVTARLAEIDRIATNSSFNGIKLLDGTNASIELQIGANSDTTTNQLSMSSFGSAKSTALGISTAVTTALADSSAAAAFLKEVDTAIGAVSTRRSQIGSYTNRLEGALQALSVTSENLRASESRIRDADIAKESSAMLKSQILQQASVSLLSQANQTPGLATSLI